MTLIKSSRAGLLALAFGILLGIFLSVATYSTSYAQAPAPGAAPAAPAAAPAAPPAPTPSCASDPDPKKAVLEKCSPNSGDTAWMLTSMALVLIMTVPGLALFYGGIVRKKNVGDTVMTSFAITCLVTIIYACLTYSLAFTPGSPYIGGLSRVFLQGILSDISTGAGNPNPLAVTIPETVYMCFQMTFAIITPALIAGAFAERMKFSAMLWFIGLWAILVYAPVAHWVWASDGMLSSGNSDAMIKVLDFAGGTVVHINAGVAGLMCAINEYGGTAGLIEGNPGQVLNQLEGIVIVFVYDAIVSLIILKIIDAIIGLRVSADVEREGLDFALHGETVQ